MVELAFEAREQLGYCELSINRCCGQVICAGAVGLLGRFKEAPAEQAREHPHRQEEAVFACHPALAVRRQTSAWDNAVHVGVVRQGCPRKCAKTIVMPICAPRCPHSAALRHCSMADITLSWPRLKRSVCRQVGPWRRKMSATSKAGLGRANRRRGSRQGANIENPCVGGSIPPRATKIIKDLASARSFLFRAREKE